ncbi:hypothetical protein M0D70_09240 [Acinetobacter portensis]|uniref:Uncharacterized protein n=2 Tax=Acinetobacter TaxID=469 RepID=A0A6L6GGT4_9GAMM|nr:MULTISPECIES: hypothetical protein [Acinetobacter]MCK7609570.1 hypothetical protein [Acinetobacter portensis]MCK7640346.1 hypothetical protein [Acinetobacter portensis]MDY6458825.1 hypothetical protein [Acinetobacter faecalis]MDY6462760.1 hypothetical protein [Acinetobacter faecalis]MDY6483970.1 hypothetical protein [Acinetobacter faecalis]
MPQLLQHIDAIAREKNRDVLFVHFEDYEENEQNPDSNRQDVLSWLEQNNIPYEKCMGLEEEGSIDSYWGDIYIDVPFDLENEQYQILSDYLEDEEGVMKIEGVYFFVLYLETAIELQAERVMNADTDFEDDTWNGTPS